MSSSFNCIALVLERLAYKVLSFFQASNDVFAVAMRGVIEEDVDAKIALRMSLSWQIQWILQSSSVAVPVEMGH